MIELKPNDRAWFKVGISVRTGYVAEVIRNGGSVLGYLIMPDTQLRSDPERGHTCGIYSVFACPAERRRLIDLLQDESDMLAEKAGALEAEL